MKTIKINPDQLYTSEEVTEFLRISMRTTQRLLKAGTLPSYKVHGQYRIKGLDILNYLGHVRKDEMLPASERLPKPADSIDLLDIPPVSVEVGLGLISLFQPEIESPVLNQIEGMRKELIKELGFIFPGIRFKDNIALKENSYQILLHGLPVVQGTLSLEKNSIEQLAEQLLAEIYQFGLQYAHEILSREEVFVIIENLRKKYHVVVEEVLKENSQEPFKLSIGQLTQLLKQLLREQVSIRPMRLILEAIADALPTTQNLEQLIELVRQRLSRYICSQISNENLLQVYTLEKDLEATLIKQVEQYPLFPDLDKSQKIQNHLSSILNPNQRLVILCDVKIRRALASLLSIKFSRVVVLSYQEIPVGFNLEVLGEIKSG